MTTTTAPRPQATVICVDECAEVLAAAGGTDFEQAVADVLALLADDTTEETR